MPKLTGFAEVSQEEASAMNSQTGGLNGDKSPFVDGVEFQITGFTWKHPEIDGVVKQDTTCLVFITTIGDLFCRMITRKRVDSEGKIIQPNGSFNQHFMETIKKNASKSNGELAKMIVDYCAGKLITATHLSYIAKDKEGRLYPSHLINLNFNK